VVAADASQQFEEHSKEKHPMKRFGRHEELANLAAFLLSDMAEYINGECVVIDGGQWLRGAGEFTISPCLPSLPGKQWKHHAERNPDAAYSGSARLRGSTRSFTTPIDCSFVSARTVISRASWLRGAFSASGGRFISTRAEPICLAATRNLPPPLCTVQPAGRSTARVNSCAAAV